jgi:hypothetical protein
MKTLTLALFLSTLIVQSSPLTAVKYFFVVATIKNPDVLPQLPASWS